MGANSSRESSSNLHSEGGADEAMTLDLDKQVQVGLSRLSSEFDEADSDDEYLNQCINFESYSSLNQALSQDKWIAERYSMPSVKEYWSGTDYGDVSSDVDEDEFEKRLNAAKFFQKYPIAILNDDNQLLLELEGVTKPRALRLGIYNKARQLNAQLKKQAKTIKDLKVKNTSLKEQLGQANSQLTAYTQTIGKLALKRILDTYDEDKGFFRKYLPFFFKSETKTIQDLRKLYSESTDTISRNQILHIVQNRDERKSYTRRSGLNSSVSFFSSNCLEGKLANSAPLSATDRAIEALAGQFHMAILGR